MKTPRIILSSVAVAALVSTSACVTDPNTGEKTFSRTAAGAAIGGTLGYLLGGVIGGDAARIIGAGIGGTAGAVTSSTTRSANLTSRPPVAASTSRKSAIRTRFWFACPTA